MTGIDAVTAATLASRIDSLLEGVSAGAPAASAAQVGVPAGAPGTATPAPLPASPLAPPAPSAQTALSDVALTLDAISRYGGDATPVVIGSVPLLTGPQIAALLVPAAAGDGGAAASAQAGAGTGAGAAPGAATAGGQNAAGSTDAAAHAAGQAAPVASAAANAAVAALAAALARAVSDSGLFYESHLAQWLAGQRPVSDLAREPQQQLTRDPGARAAGDGNAPASSASSGSPGGASAQAGSAAAQDAHGAPAGQFGASGALAYASQAADNGANRLLDALANPAGTADANAANGAANNAAAMATVHPATLPLVRQQLDLLATEQFRWAGEAWPGARLDWSIEPDTGSAQGGDGQMAWRTRLVLSLPSLGAVDAELVLTGSQVVARLGATDAGAARLSAHGDQLRQRLLASGLELGGLSIRAVDAAPDAFDTFASRAAAAAYGQAAAARDAARGAPAPASRPLGDFDDKDALGFLDDGAWL
ncbi:MAG: flagellar hook-length control protein FliK [Burkholderia sp.]